MRTCAGAEQNGRNMGGRGYFSHSWTMGKSKHDKDRDSENSACLIRMLRCLSQLTVGQKLIPRAEAEHVLIFPICASLVFAHSLFQGADGLPNDQEEKLSWLWPSRRTTLPLLFRDSRKLQSGEVSLCAVLRKQLSNKVTTLK